MKPSSSTTSIGRTQRRSSSSSDLADLEKAIKSRSTPEQLVGSLADRTPDAQGCANVHHLEPMLFQHLSDSPNGSGPFCIVHLGIHECSRGHHGEDVMA
jgi:hypothetical protein